MHRVMVSLFVVLLTVSALVLAFGTVSRLLRPSGTVAHIRADIPEKEYFLRADDEEGFIGGFYLEGESVRFRGSIEKFIDVVIGEINKNS